MGRIFWSKIGLVLGEILCEFCVNFCVICVLLCVLYVKLRGLQRKEGRGFGASRNGRCGAGSKLEYVVYVVNISGLWKRVRSLFGRTEKGEWGGFLNFF